MLDENKKEYCTCIVANIIGKYHWGQDKEIKNGTKHFRPGAKVYCVFMYGGMGHDSVRVLGKPRKASRFIDVVIRTCYIKNCRLQKTYDPKVLAFLKKHSGNSNPEMPESFLQSVNSRHIEIAELK